MAKQQKPPAIVAELARPETAHETASRKAENSRLYRQRKTVNNLVLSLLVSLGLVVLIVLMAPGLLGGKNGSADRTVDVAELAADAAPSAGRALAAPDVPGAWKAKQAELRGGGDVTSWQINYTTVDETTGQEAYAAVVQAFTADGSPVNEMWLAQQLDQQVPTGSARIGDLDWIVYDHGDRNPDNANMLFGLQSSWEGAAILVYGTDSPDKLKQLAKSVAESLASAPPLPSADSSAGSTDAPTKEPR